MNREALDRWSERGILGLVLAILSYGPLATGAVRTPDFLILQGLTLGVVALWGLRFWLHQRPQLLWPPICWAVVAFALYAIGRYLTADIEYVARREMLHVLVYAFLFLAIVNNLHRQESVQLIIFTLVFLATAISFYAIYQFLTDSNRVWHYVVPPFGHRASGTYISPNHLGGFLEMLLPLGLAYTLVGRLKPVAKVFLGYAALVLVAGIAVTVSRGTWMAASVALLLLFGVLLFHRNYRLPALVLLAVVVGAGAFFVPRTFPFERRLKQLFTQGKVNDDLRFALWEPAFRVWQENVWWGAGPAHFDYRFRKYRPDDVQKQPDRAHNDYLNTLADWGAVGTALVASAWVLLWVGVVKTWRFVRGTPNDLGGKKGSNKFAFVLGASLGLIAILVHSVVDFNMHIPANAILAITLMALLSSHLRFATERYWAGMGAWAKVLGSFVLLTGLVYLGGQTWRDTWEYVWLDRAERAPTFSPAQIGLLEKAFAVEPMNSETAYAIGEAYRVQSKEGDENYRELAEKAMTWFERSQRLNRWDGYGYLRYGLCLDWVGKPDEAAPYFAKAEELDPNGYFTLANIGLHYVQLGDYAAAKPWFERSLSLQWFENPIARSYLAIANRKMLEAATNDLSARLNFQAPSSP